MKVSGVSINGRPIMGIGGITPAMKLKLAAKVLQMHPA